MICRKFFGTDAGNSSTKEAPKRQSTLSFSNGNRRKEAKKSEVSEPVKEATKPCSVFPNSPEPGPCLVRSGLKAGLPEGRARAARLKVDSFARLTARRLKSRRNQWNSGKHLTSVSKDLGSMTKRASRVRSLDERRLGRRKIAPVLTFLAP